MNKPKRNPDKLISDVLTDIAIDNGRADLAGQLLDHEMNSYFQDWLNRPDYYRAEIDKLNCPALAEYFELTLQLFDTLEDSDETHQRREALSAQVSQQFGSMPVLYDLLDDQLEPETFLELARIAGRT